MDIILCILPKIETDAPTVGPAILKSHCISAGFSCQIRDLNIELYNHLQDEDRYVWKENDRVFVDEKRWDEFYELRCKDAFETWADQLVGSNARWIGLSVFSNYSKLSAVKLVSLIKERNPGQMIVVGGAGIYKDIDLWSKIGVDHWIVGDAEESLIKLLQGKLDDPGIDNRSPVQLTNLDSILLPDYDDIDFSLYTNGDRRMSYITSSRGCIRDCTFCDVATMWPKYRFRKSDSVVKEIMHARERYGIRHFYFTDSLINGGLKNFRNLCNSLAEYRNSVADSDWECGGQFICRDKGQFTPDDYDLMKKAGFGWVSIGVESASESVRDHMRKGFTNEDMLYTFEQLKRVGIDMTLMFIIGYPTETKEDFEETLSLITRLGNDGYFNEPNPAVKTINFFDQVLFAGTPIYDMHASLGIINRNRLSWELPGNNIRVRIVRLMQAYETLERYAKGKGHWMTVRTRNELSRSYSEISGRQLPADVLSYDESLEYNSI